MNLLVFDFGAGSGRAIVFRDAEKKLQGEEVHRFVNQPRTIGDVFCWDIDGLYANLLTGLKIAAAMCQIDCLGIDCWGADYVVTDEDGFRSGEAVHYRDKLSDLSKAYSDGIVPPLERWRRTGIAQHSFNTLYRLSYRKHRGKILFIPDYFAYLLTGEWATEETIASTGELLKYNALEFDGELCRQMGIDTNIFSPLAAPCGERGKLTEKIKKQCGICYDITVVNVCSHDTASAVAAIPTTEKDFVYISSGTWSLMGTELTEPILSNAAYLEGFTNERGIGGSVRFLKNIMGMWILMRLRKDYMNKGVNLSFQDFVELAQECPDSGLFDVNDGSLINPPDMADAINALLQKNAYKTSSDLGYLAKSAFLSLSLEYGISLDRLSYITGKSYGCIYIVGGGSNNDYLNQLTADAVNIPVYAGIPEATSMGNVLCQLMFKGGYTLKQGRKLIGESAPLKVFYPQNFARKEEYKKVKEYKEVGFHAGR